MRLNEITFDLTDLTDFSDPDKLFKNLDFVVKVRENFNLDFFYEYLNELRESGIVNMFAAAPYLYLGSERIKAQIIFEFNGEAPNEEAGKNVIEMADNVKMEIINNVYEYLLAEYGDINMNKVERGVKNFSTVILTMWMQQYEN